MIPEGFVLMRLAGAFTESFGPVYLNAATQSIGFRVSAPHLNPTGVCHGGALATFADMQIAALPLYESGAAIHRPTISLSIDYLAAAPAGAWVEAAVICLKMTRSLLFSQAIITADGVAVARSSGIYRNYQNPSSPTSL